MSYNFGSLKLNQLNTSTISSIDDEINFTGNTVFTGVFDVSEGNIITSDYGVVKYSFKTIDHNGWVILDGRLKSSLTSTQQTNATSLGFGVNIPDATDRILFNKGALQSIGGSENVTILQTHLPEYNLTSGSGSGTTASDGDHQHRYSTWFPQNNGFPDGHADRGGPPAAQYWYGPASTTPTSTTTAPSPSGPSVHTHSVTLSGITVPSGGGDTTLSIVPKYLSVNVFVYLGL